MLWPHVVARFPADEPGLPDYRTAELPDPASNCALLPVVRKPIMDHCLDTPPLSLVTKALTEVR